MPLIDEILCSLNFQRPIVAEKLREIDPLYLRTTFLTNFLIDHLQKEFGLISLPEVILEGYLREGSGGILRKSSKRRSRIGKKRKTNSEFKITGVKADTRIRYPRRGDGVIDLRATNHDLFAFPIKRNAYEPYFTLDIEIDSLDKHRSLNKLVFCKSKLAHHVLWVRHNSPETSVASSTALEKYNIPVVNFFD